MLAETLIVASFISITLIYLFVQFRNINNNYSDTIMYNSVNGLYINNEIKKFISQYDMDDLSQQIAYSDLGYYDLTSCNADIFTDTEYCEEFFSRLNIKTAIYTFEKVNVISTEFSSKFIDFLQSVQVDNSYMYIIATEFNDGSFASIRLDGYSYPTLEDNIKKQSIVTTGDGLYENSTTEYLFKGASVNNNINVYGYKGKIISITSQGIKVLLSKEENLSFDNTTAFYTKDGLLTHGSYEADSKTNSLLFASLNKMCSNCEDIITNVNWNVGKITTLVGNSLSNILTNEASTIYRAQDNSGYVGTLSVSDILKSSSDSSCNYSSITSDCLNNNWLVDGNIWTFNSNSSNTVWSVTSGAFANSNITDIKDAYAVVYLNGSMRAIGSGTIEDPYRAL
ncbi:MAG: hypothetical protein PHD02_00745 [Bacilli bacterium]|nr:hypothetical protein [Bacilli bacterium]